MMQNEAEKETVSGRKAIALMSGGLDSNLAVRVLHDMGIEIIGVHFTGPFCMCNRGAGGCIHYAKKIADEIGIRFSTVGLGKAYLDIVSSPKHGRGSGMNPCVDCRVLMFRGAKKMMIEEGASFIVTGEVLGQRPMSQLRHKLQLIEREAELEGLILRPLSAHHFPETLPEREGWVDRAKLLDIQGRGRRPQMDLAEKLQLGDYPCPAGGCLLTDKHFASRLRDHLAHGELRMTDIPLLKIGRHFRLPGDAKLVVGRNEDENNRIESLAVQGDLVLTPETVMGPAAVLREHNENSDALSCAASIVAGYCDGTGDVVVLSRTEGGSKDAQSLDVSRQSGEAYRV